MPRPEHGRTLAGRKKAAGFEWGALGTLLPYLWSRTSFELKFRVVLALAFLAAAKVANVSVPVLLKDAVEILSGHTGPVMALPIGLLIAYGIARVCAIAFAELRDAVFAKVGQRA